MAPFAKLDMILFTRSRAGKVLVKPSCSGCRASLEAHMQHLELFTKSPFVD